MVKRILIGLVVLGVVGLVGAGLWARSVITGRIGERRAELEKGFAAHHADVVADHAWLATLDFFKPAVAKSDAGPFLNQRLEWTGAKQAVDKWTAALPKDHPTLVLEPAVRDALAKDWLTADAAIWEKRDFAWMAGLKDFSHWDLEANSPWAATKPIDRFNVPIPTFLTLIQWSKLRLLKGLKEGQAAQAGAEVHELARLCYSTEVLIGAMISLAILGIENDAREKAAKDGQSVEGWTTFDKPARDRMKRALFALPAYAMVETPEDRAKAFETFKVGRCVALNESCMIALLLRPTLKERYPAGYEGVSKNLAAATECRLTSLRAAWAAPDDPANDPLINDTACQVGESPEVCGALKPVSSLPGFRGLAGEVLLTVAGPDWFNQYKKAAEPAPTPAPK